MTFRGQATALWPVQLPLPRPAATPSPRKGKGSSAPAARCAVFFIVSIAFTFVFISCKTGCVVFEFKRESCRASVLCLPASTLLAEKSAHIRLPFRANTAKGGLLSLTSVFYTKLREQGQRGSRCCCYGCRENCCSDSRCGSSERCCSSFRREARGRSF